MIAATVFLVLFVWFWQAEVATGKLSIRRALTGTDADLAVVFPLTWSPQSGEFTLQFTIGQNHAVITAVPDTGSEYLIIGGKNCSSCDSSQGVYDESGIDTGDTQTARYGSQTDNISWFIDDMIVSGVTEPINVEFGTITSASGSSNLNVFGLIGSENTTDKTPFINQVMYSQQLIAPVFVFDMSSQNNATLTLGGSSDGVSGNTVPLLSRSQAISRIGNDLGISFYLIDIQAILVDGNAVDAPAVCMLDSGTTDLVCSTTLGKSLQNFKSLEIKFSNFSLTYESDMVQNVQSDSSFDDAGSFNKQVVILGNQFWIGRIFSFDLQHHLLTVSNPDPAAT